MLFVVHLDLYWPTRARRPSDDVLVPLWWRPTIDDQPLCVTDEHGVTRPVLCGGTNVGEETAHRVALLLSRQLDEVVTPGAVRSPVTRGEWLLWLHDDEQSVLHVTEAWLDAQRPGRLPSWPPR